MSLVGAAKEATGLTITTTAAAAIGGIASFPIAATIGLFSATHATSSYISHKILGPNSHFLTKTITAVAVAALAVFSVPYLIGALSIPAFALITPQIALAMGAFQLGMQALFSLASSTFSSLESNEDLENKEPIHPAITAIDNNQEIKSTEPVVPSPLVQKAPLSFSNKVKGALFSWTQDPAKIATAKKIALITLGVIGTAAFLYYAASNISTGGTNSMPEKGDTNTARTASNSATTPTTTTTPSSTTTSTTTTTSNSATTPTTTTTPSSTTTSTTTTTSNSATTPTTTTTSSSATTSNTTTDSNSATTATTATTTTTSSSATTSTTTTANIDLGTPLSNLDENIITNFVSDLFSNPINAMATFGGGIATLYLIKRIFDKYTYKPSNLSQKGTDGDQAAAAANPAATDPVIAAGAAAATDPVIAAAAANPAATDPAIAARAARAARAAAANPAAAAKVETEANLAAIARAAAAGAVAVAVAAAAGAVAAAAGADPAIAARAAEAAAAAAAETGGNLAAIAAAAGAAAALANRTAAVVAATVTESLKDPAKAAAAGVAAAGGDAKAATTAAIAAMAAERIAKVVTETTAVVVAAAAAAAAIAAANSATLLIANSTATDPEEKANPAATAAKKIRTNSATVETVVTNAAKAATKAAGATLATTKAVRTNLETFEAAATAEAIRVAKIDSKTSQALAVAAATAGAANAAKAAVIKKFYLENNAKSCFNNLTIFKDLKSNYYLGRTLVYSMRATCKTDIESNIIKQIMGIDLKNGTHRIEKLLSPEEDYDIPSVEDPFLLSNEQQEPITCTQISKSTNLDISGSFETTLPNDEKISALWETNTNSDVSDYQKCIEDYLHLLFSKNNNLISNQIEFRTNPYYYTALSVLGKVLIEKEKITDFAIVLVKNNHFFCLTSGIVKAIAFEEMIPSLAKNPDDALVKYGTFSSSLPKTSKADLSFPIYKRESQTPTPLVTAGTFNNAGTTIGRIILLSRVALRYSSPNNTHFAISEAGSPSFGNLVGKNTSSLATTMGTGVANGVEGFVEIFSSRGWFQKPKRIKQDPITNTESLKKRVDGLVDSLTKTGSKHAGIAISVLELRPKEKEDT